jgi:hydrogenase maturation protein HypF
MAAAVLHGLGRGDEIEARFGPLVGAQAARLVRTLMERQVNSPRTTSAGRWFDAAAGALGLCLHQRVEAEAAMLLEQRASQWLEAHPEFAQPWTSLDLAPLVADLFSVEEGDLEQTARGAARFHLGLVNGLADSAIAAARRCGTRTVVLGGGCFFNKVLLVRLSAALSDAGLVVLRPEGVGCGDAGLALGQAWVAACTVEATLLNPSTVEV